MLFSYCFQKRRKYIYRNLYPPQPSLENREGVVRNKMPDFCERKSFVNKSSPGMLSEAEAQGGDRGGTNGKRETINGNFKNESLTKKHCP